MLTGATIEVSSTPLPRAVPLASGAAGGGGGAVGVAATATTSDSEDGQLSSWQEQQKKFAAAAAEKKDKPTGYPYQLQPPTLSKGTCPAGPAVAGLGRDSSSPSGGWEEDSAITAAAAAAAAAAAPAVPAAATADSGWRATYASSLYCLLPTWLLRFRRAAYSPLRDDTCAAGSHSSSSPAASGSSSSRSNAAAAGGGSAAAGAETSSFGDAPFPTVCLHCHKAVITTVAFRISCIGICLCVLSPLILGWPGLCLSPFIYVALKDAVHTCPQCRNLIHRQSRVSVPFFGLRDEVVTVKCGNCAVVLSRRYLVLFTALVLLIILFYVLRAGWLGSSLDVISKGPPTTLSWHQFYEQCGQRSQLGNSLKAGANFRDSFAGKTVEWKGLVKQVKEGFFSSNVMFLIMSPTITLSGGSQSNGTGEGGDSDGRSGADDTSSGASDSTEEGGKDTAAAEGGATRRNEEDSDSSSNGSEDDTLEEEDRALQGDGADLALAFNGRELSAKVEKLEPGDRVEFQATLVALGRRGKPSLGRLWDVTLVEKREARQARLEEWRAKKAERQHLLQRLLLPIIGSPFSDFGGFGPFGSLFSSTGGFSGSGVVVIRRQIISPTATFSVISSSSSDDAGPRITPPFGDGETSITGVPRAHVDEEDKESIDSSSSGTDHADVADMFAGYGGVTHGSAAAKHYEAMDTLGSAHGPGDGPFVMHVDKEAEEDHLRVSHGDGVTYGGHRVPAWGTHVEEEADEEVPLQGARAARRGSGGTYVHVREDEGEQQPQAAARRYGTGESHGTAPPASALPRGAEPDGKKQQQHLHEGGGDDGDEDEEEDSTLAALKAAVELQRQRRAQQEEQIRRQQQRQREHAQVEQQRQAFHGEQQHPQQEPPERSATMDTGKNTADVPTKVDTGTRTEGAQAAQEAHWMHGGKAGNTPLHRVPGQVDADHDPYTDSKVIPKHVQSQQTPGSQQHQTPLAHPDGGAASMQHDKGAPDGTASGAPTAVPTAESGVGQP